MIPAPETKVDIKERSSLALAFLGDGVFELLVRAHIVAAGRASLLEMNQRAVSMVSAQGQNLAYQGLLPLLTEQEKEVVRRGRNAKKTTTAKHATAVEYHAATALEALFGWLYLENNIERINELFSHIWQNCAAAESADG